MVAREDHFEVDTKGQSFCDCVKSLCNPKFLGTVFLVVAMAATIITLVVLGYIEALAIQVRALGAVGHVIFVFVIIFMNQPFAWGAGVSFVVCGFMFGWMGLLTVHVGIFLGSSLTFLVTKRWFVDLVKRKVDELEPELRGIMKNMLAATSGSSLKSWGLCVGIRQTPLTLGLLNAIMATSDITYPKFVATTHIAAMLDTPLLVSVGIAIDKAGNSITELTPEAQARQDALTYFQIGMAVVILVGSGWYGKRLMNQYKDDPETLARESIRYSDKEGAAKLEAALERERAKLNAERQAEAGAVVPAAGPEAA